MIYIKIIGPQTICAHKIIMQEKDTIIFDLDGTLVDSAPDLHACANRLLKRYHQPTISLKQSQKFIGDGVRQFVKSAWLQSNKEMDESQLTKLQDEFLLDYQNQPAQLSETYPGVRETLDQLSHFGYKMAVCTNKPQVAAETLLKNLGLRDYFSQIAGGDFYGVKKPNKLHLLNLLNDLGKSASSAVMIGDNEHDAHTAKAAETIFVICTYGYARIPLKDIHFDFKIDKFSELLTLEVFRR